MKVLILEDEFRNYNRLRRMLTDIDPTMTIEGPLESVEEAKQWFAHHKSKLAPDLVMADIRLSDGVSFDALRSIDPRSALVFTTAYDEYALKAFQYNGLAYLMKPIEEEELRQTIARVKNFLLRDTAPPESQGLNELIAKIQKQEGGYRERFLIPYKDGYEVVRTEAVSHICTEYKDTRLYLRSGKCFSLSQSLDELERQLNPRNFVRVNRQYIVHIDSIEGLKTFFGGKLLVKLRGFEKLEIFCSRERAPLLKEWLNQ